jgi:choline dehydrogenase-like flavoprotein
MREYSVIASAEPIPLEENRLELIPERDALGLRRIKLTYKPSPMEEKAWMAAADKLSSALGVTGMGRLHITYKREEEDSFDEWGNHHYGTTRMHASPKKGVVDGDLRVHGTHNLFVCSTSVYPIAGMMTPTLTLVALSLRLADKLKEELQSS